MKLIGRLVLGVIAIVFVNFALANRAEEVTLSLWPLPLDVTLRLYVVVLGGLAAGLIAGVAMSWLPRFRLRRRVRAAERRAATLERSAAGTAGTAAALPPARYQPALSDD